VYQVGTNKGIINTSFTVYFNPLFIWPCYGWGSFCSPLTTDAQVSCWASLWEFCGVLSGMGTGFTANTSVFLCQHYPTNALYSSLSTCCSYQQDKWTKHGKLQQAVLFHTLRIVRYKSTLKQKPIVYCNFIIYSR